MKQFLIIISLFISLIAKAYDFEDNGFYFNIISAVNHTAEITSSPSKYEGDVVIPAVATYRNQQLNVVKIGAEAFRACNNLNTVIIPEGITNIGSQAFYYCTALTNVTFPQTLERIEDRYAFSGCHSLKQINLPDNLQYLGGYAFCDTGLETLELPSNVIRYGHSIFSKCSKLKTITIPRWMKDVDGMFSESEAIENIYVLDPIPPTSNDYGFFNRRIQLNANVFIPINSKKEYVASPQWSKFFSLEESASLGTAYYIDVTCGKNGSLEMLGTTINGNASSNGNTHRFGEFADSNIEITLIPNPNQKYRVKSILTNEIENVNSMVDNKYSFVLNQDTKIATEFVKYYDVTFRSIGEHGSMKINDIDFHDDMVTLQIDEYTPTDIFLTVEEGYESEGKFTKGGWSSAFKKIDNTHYILEQPHDAEISFNYNLINITLHCSCIGKGLLRINNTHSVNSSSTWMECGADYFSEVKIEAIPDNGYHLQSLLVGTKDVTSEVSDGIYIFTATNEFYSSDKDQIDIHATYEYGVSGIDETLVHSKDSDYIIYNIYGTQINTPLEKLPRGIYIIKYPKHVKKISIK